MVQISHSSLFNLYAYLVFYSSCLNWIFVLVLYIVRQKTLSIGIQVIMWKIHLIQLRFATDS